jgi:hypothetical protein
MANAMPFDLNGDQRTDILTTTVLMNNATQNVALLQTSNGTYTPQTLASPSSDAGWVVQGYGDFDGDLVADDLFWWNLASGQTALVTFSNSGLSSTVNLTAVQSFDYLPEFADFNGDGRTDVAWQNAQGNTAEVWLMDGNGIASKLTSPLDIANLMPSLESLTVHPFKLPELPDGFLTDGLVVNGFSVPKQFGNMDIAIPGIALTQPKLGDMTALGLRNPLHGLDALTGGKMNSTIAAFLKGPKGFVGLNDKTNLAGEIGKIGQSYFSALEFTGIVGKQPGSTTNVGQQPGGSGSLPFETNGQYQDPSLYAGGTNAGDVFVAWGKVVATTAGVVIAVATLPATAPVAIAATVIVGSLAIAFESADAAKATNDYQQDSKDPKTYTNPDADQEGVLKPIEQVAPRLTSNSTPVNPDGSSGGVEIDKTALPRNPIAEIALIDDTNMTETITNVTPSNSQDTNTNFGRPEDRPEAPPKPNPGNPNNGQIGP